MTDNFADLPKPAPVSARLWKRFEELGVGYIGGAEDMTDEELTLEATKLLQWRDQRLVEGAPLYPANVCVKCLHPHLPLEHKTGCTSSRTGRPK